jgi:hypothetical protein
MELLKPKGDSTRISQPHDQIEHFDTTYSWCRVSNESSIIMQQLASKIIISYWYHTYKTNERNNLDFSFGCGFYLRNIKLCICINFKKLDVETKKWSMSFKFSDVLWLDMKHIQKFGWIFEISLNIRITERQIQNNIC